jgi:hypothetical protein
LANETPVISSGDNAIGDFDDIKPEILLLQTGYLTIKEIFSRIGGSSEYSLGIPNTEIAKEIVPLLLKTKAPKKSLGTTSLANEIKNYLLSLDMEGIEKSFGQFLTLFPYDLHTMDEKYYHNQFLVAMMIAELPLSSQKHVSNGIIDSYFKGKNDDDFIVEIKYLYEPKTPKGEYPAPPILPKKIEALREKMDSKANEAIEQITAKYSKACERGSGRLMVSIVVTRRVVVLAKYTEMNKEHLNS